MICNQCAVIAAWSRKTLKLLYKLLRFWKNDILRQNFQNSVPKVFIASPIDVLCSNFVKFSRWVIGEIVRYLPDKKIAWFSSSRYCADRAQNLSGLASDNVLRVLQISFKSVHLRRSYSQTREHQNAKTRRKVNPIFGWSLASSQIKTYYFGRQSILIGRRNQCWIW